MDERGFLQRRLIAKRIEEQVEATAPITDDKDALYEFVLDMIEKVNEIFREGAGNISQTTDKHIHDLCCYFIAEKRKQHQKTPLPSFDESTLVESS
jgi:hypothetical protein